MASSGLTRFKRLLSQHQHVGLDSMCFMYQFAKHPKYSSLTKTIFTRLEENKLTATTSTISVIETLVQPEKKNNQELIKDYQKVFQLLPNLQILPVDYHLSLLTAKLRAKYPKIRLPDAIQISAAILNKSKVFITNDKQLNQVKQIKVKLLNNYLDK